MLSFADEHVSFRELVERSLRSTSSQFSDVYPFLEFGLYAEQLERLFRVVERHRVRIYFYEDYCLDAAAMFRDILRFLEVDESFVPAFDQRHLVMHVPRSFALRRWLKRTGAWRLASRVLPHSVRETLKVAAMRPRAALTLDPADRAFVAEYYRRDLHTLGNLLGRDFRSWLTPGQ
jgi:hypothetical protein